MISADIAHGLFGGAVMLALGLALHFGGRLS